MALAQIDSDSRTTTNGSMAHISLMPWVMTKKDCERLTVQSKLEVQSFYERVLEERNVTQGRTVEAFERLLKEKDSHHERLLKGKEWHVADLQKDMEGLQLFSLVLCIVFALVILTMAVLYSNATKARNEQVRKLDARVSKSEGIIEEKEKRILEVLQQLNNIQGTLQEKDQRILELLQQMHNQQHSNNHRGTTTMHAAIPTTPQHMM